ncbi:E3 ubiquitin-protein ligase rnf152-B-like [Penaeus indicus]|uniref:E3 ubiquitin-protein ligase rnf152-B-like n=1 Tax=Penaeus indicus TaxID=29960 RepID=UPI00300D0A59
MPIECRVCRSCFAPGAHAPVMLSCGHSTCRKCLERLQEQAQDLKCPICRKSHEGADLTELRDNYDLLDAATTPAEQELLKIVIIGLDGRARRVRVSPQDKIVSILKELHARYGLDVDNMTLSRGGRKLGVDQTIGSYRVTEGTILQLTTKHLGGAGQV